MNTDVMFSSKTDMWETPQDFFDELNKEFDFTLDVCANSENAKCEKFYTKERNGLKYPWCTSGSVWCNPPYGKGIEEWVKKAFEDSYKFNQKIVMLLPARTDTKWFHDYIYGKNRVDIRFVRGRLKFGNSKNSAPFPSMVVVFRGSSI